jgi:hypothetical protein
MWDDLETVTYFKTELKWCEEPKEKVQLAGYDKEGDGQGTASLRCPPA